jgi:hypothetical protein
MEILTLLGSFTPNLKEFFFLNIDIIYDHNY